MAQNRHYPAVVLLDNENNPITPLVDITSIYADPLSKEDAGVIGSPVLFEDMDERIYKNGSELVDENGDPLCLIIGAYTKNHQLILQRVRASTILGNLSPEIWENLQEASGLDLATKDEAILQVKIS